MDAATIGLGLFFLIFLIVLVLLVRTVTLYAPPTFTEYFGDLWRGEARSRSPQLRSWCARQRAHVQEMDDFITGRGHCPALVADLWVQQQLTYVRLLEQLLDMDNRG
jgi:hypothetical protein